MARSSTTVTIWLRWQVLEGRTCQIGRRHTTPRPSDPGSGCKSPCNTIFRYYYRSYWRNTTTTCSLLQHHLVFAYICAPPDIGYSVTTLSKFGNCPAPLHYGCRKTIAKYLRRTIHWKTYYTKPALILRCLCRVLSLFPFRARFVFIKLFWTIAAC
jgi:hypothetical protein